MNNTEILEWYMKGWNDELKGTSSLESSDPFLQTAYNHGAMDALAGDDVSSVDLKSDDEIIREIKHITMERLANPNNGYGV